MQPKKLEQYKYFQPFAWALCISFAGFVGLLALQLQGTAEKLADSSNSYVESSQIIEETINVNPQ